MRVTSLITTLIILTTPVFAGKTKIVKTERVEAQVQTPVYLTITLRVPQNMNEYTKLKELIQMIDDVPYKGVFVTNVSLSDIQPRKIPNRPLYLPKVDSEGNVIKQKVNRK